MNIADRIKLLRGEQSREQFSEGTDASAQTLYKYEKRTGKPTIEFVDKICKKFNVCHTWLITGEGPMHPGEALQTQELQANAPETPPEAAGACRRCAKLEAELEMERAERRELSAENRQLWNENAVLREEVATLRERQKTCYPDPIFKTTQAIPSNNEELQT